MTPSTSTVALLARRKDFLEDLLTAVRSDEVVLLLVDVVVCRPELVPRFKTA